MSSMGHFSRFLQIRIMRSTGLGKAHTLYSNQNFSYNIEMQEGLILKNKQTFWTSLNLSKIHLGESLIPTNSAEYTLRNEFTTLDDKEKLNFLYMQILLSLRMLSIKVEVFGH